MRTVRTYAKRESHSDRTMPGRSYDLDAGKPKNPYLTPSRPASVARVASTSPSHAPRVLSASQRMRAINMQNAGAMTVASPAYRGNQATIPSPSSQQSPTSKAQHPSKAPKRSARSHKDTRNMLLFGALAVFILVGIIFLALGLGAGMIYSGGILPGVSAAGVELGGMSQAEAQTALANGWSNITLRDGERTWQVERESLGIMIDTVATAEDAYRQGRGTGNPISAIFGNLEVTPFVTVNSDDLTTALEAISDDVSIDPVNAGVALVNGQVQATPARTGRLLNISGTVSRLQNNGSLALSRGSVDLVMIDTQPAVTDASGIVQAASQLLSNPLTIRVHDPMTGDNVYWTASPTTWANWITATTDPDSPTGLALTVQETPLRQFLTAEANVLDSTRYLAMDEAVASIQNAIANNTTTASLRVYHHDRQHTVQQGETITSIAWDYGVPYPWVQQANPGIDTLSVGQTITIPSVDNFLPYDVVMDKRIVVDISEQRVRVYENGQMIHDWITSTGIADSPTWTGVYQILSHEISAYAGNWNLDMPYFMGVYQPIPGQSFTNGFHGYPTRRGGQLLWRNNLGTRVTYGCIMLSDENVQWLYDWAEEGVVVQIQA